MWLTAGVQGYEVPHRFGEMAEMNGWWGHWDLNPD
tara:strand:+ start:1102 stop:1206 length:105 start_codon:yes stop_codon:yes gene_type:complete